jgi:putative N6-adenine-specific DNA methylase
MMKGLLATTLSGLEDLLAGELESIGAESLRVRNRAVSFSGDMAMMYRANVHLRTALRILNTLNSFPCRDEDDIYRGIRGMEWENHMDTHQRLAVDTVLVSSRYRHSGFISQRVKDGIVDRFRDRTGRRPSVDLKNPDLRIHIHLNDARCTVSLDSSGESLHKRGYRRDPYKAPLNEVLAAGMILLSGWNPVQPFLNPMCGSGTLCIEAGMMAKGLPGGYFRNEFGFQHWKNYDPALYESIRRERYLPAAEAFTILACDHSFPAIRAAQNNLAGAGMLNKVKLEKVEFGTWAPGAKEGVIIMNPPYGARMQDDQLHVLYRDIGDVLKNRFPGFQAWILSGNPHALKHVALKPGQKWSLYNGPIPCKYQSYDLYRGSRKIVNKSEKYE